MGWAVTTESGQSCPPAARPAAGGVSGRAPSKGEGTVTVYSRSEITRRARTQEDRTLGRRKPIRSVARGLRFCRSRRTCSGFYYVCCFSVSSFTDFCSLYFSFLLIILDLICFSNLISEGRRQNHQFQKSDMGHHHSKSYRH